MYDYKRRFKSSQVWEIGNTVKVGFLTLKIVGGVTNQWILENKDGSKKYRFEPHLGLFAI